MWYYYFVVKRFYPQHLRERRRKIFLTIAGFVSLVVLSGGVGIYKWKSSQVVWKDYIGKGLRIKLNYPETFVEEVLSEEYQKANIVFRIQRDSPTAFFSLRYEDKLGVMKAFGKDILGQLVAAVDRRYPISFPDYEKIDYKDITLVGEKAAQFDFTYTGADGKAKIRQRFVIVVKDETAYYLTVQAPESEFSKSEREFDKIIGSFEFVK